MSGHEFAPDAHEANHGNNLSPDQPNPDDTVYFLHQTMPLKVGSGEIVRPTGTNDFHVQSGETAYRVRGWNMFTLAEVVTLAPELFPQIEEEYRDFTHGGLATVLQDMDKREELAIRLTPDAIEKNLHTHRTPSDLGYVAPRRLIGVENDPHSNVARLQKVLQDARRGVTNNEAKGYVDLARFDAEDALELQEALDTIEESIQVANRQTLDKLYEMFGANVLEPAVFERQESPHLMETLTIRMLVDDRAYFIERGYHRCDERGIPEMEPYVVSACMYAGIPNTDKLYLQNFVQIS